jgi:acetylornithine deacetylase/succinyl-diaminopimelate desuccinylase-like protein
MDVVPARAEEWSVPPFSAEVRDGFLYGHGKIHGVDERIPVDGIAEMTEIVYALVERWNATR